MTVRILFIAILFLTACGRIRSTPGTRTVDTISGLVKDTGITNAQQLSADRRFNSEKADTSFDCVKALHALVYSALKTPLKEFEFTVWVDTVNADSAILEIVHRNEERGDDVPFNWLKMDFKNNQIIDLSADSDKQVALRYDTILYNKIIKHCR